MSGPQPDPNLDIKTAIEQFKQAVKDYEAQQRRDKLRIKLNERKFKRLARRPRG